MTKRRSTSASTSRKRTPHASKSSTRQSRPKQSPRLNGVMQKIGWVLLIACGLLTAWALLGQAMFAKQ